MYKIFISHNSKDKSVVEPIALKLADIFGQNEVFYDSWSIKPGDGIIDKMNEGLQNCRFVFFFVSQNSLKSYMVALEWQNAIMKVSKGQAKLIPVRMDNCEMPALLLQTLYIDLFSNGLEICLRQMIDLIKEDKIFHPKFTQIKNLSAKYVLRTDREIVVELNANYFMEPISHFAFATPNNQDEISYSCKGFNMYTFGFNKSAISIAAGFQMNGIRIDFPEPLVPGFPQQVVFKALKENPIAIFAILHEEKQNMWKAVI